MPHTKSAAKRLRQDEKRRRRNRSVARALKLKRKAVASALAGSDLLAAGVAVQAAQSSLDRAAVKGYIHPNKAARLKSRMARKLNASSGCGTPQGVMNWFRQIGRLMQRTAAPLGRVQALQEKLATLRRDHPNQYVAYRDGWDAARGVLTFEVLLVKPTRAEITTWADNLPDNERDRITVEFTEVLPPGLVKSNYDLARSHAARAE